MDYQTFTFTPSGRSALLLGGVLLATEDEHGARLASFEYLKRDGAEVEPMGAAQARFVFRLILSGSAPITQGGAKLTASERYAELVRTVRTQPRGLLVHPRLGRWQAALRSVRSKETPKQAWDAVECALEFVEDQLDQAIAADSTPTPQTQANRTLSVSSALALASAAQYAPSPKEIMQRVDRSITTLVAKTEAYVEYAIEISHDIKAAIESLRTALNSVDGAREEMFKLLDLSLDYTLEGSVSLVRYKDAGYQIMASCIELYRSIESLKPPVVSYTVPSQMTLDELLIALYGGEAATHRAELLSLNRIPSPMAIPAGAVLRLVSPSVVQT